MSGWKVAKDLAFFLLLVSVGFGSSRGFGSPHNPKVGRDPQENLKKIHERDSPGPAGEGL